MSGRNIAGKNNPRGPGKPGPYKGERRTAEREGEARHGGGVVAEPEAGATREAA